MRLLHNKYRIALVCCLLFIICPGIAGINSDLVSFFKSFGFKGTATDMNAFENQAAGHISGGSIVLRDSVRNMKLAHVDAPSFKAGCGGIDAFMGSFSFVNGPKIISFFKSVMNNAVGYGFNLALETAVPEIAHSMQYIQSIAQRMNDINMNSCALAENLVGGMWPKIRTSQQQICQDIGTRKGFFSDWAAARQGCGVGTDFAKQINKASTDPQYKNEVIINKNIIWDALSKNGLTHDTELAEFFMSLSGTLIFNQRGSFDVLQPITYRKNLIRAILYGGNIEVYACKDTNKCLHVTKEKIKIEQHAALISQSKNFMMSLIEKAKKDKELSQAQATFLNMLSVPAFKLTSVFLKNAQQKDTAANFNTYCEIIARDFLHQYLIESLRLVQSSTIGIDYPGKDNLEKNIQSAIEYVNHVNDAMLGKLTETSIVTNSIKEMDKNAARSVQNTTKGTMIF